MSNIKKDDWLWIISDRGYKSGDIIILGQVERIVYHEPLIKVVIKHRWGVHSGEDIMGHA